MQSRLPSLNALRAFEVTARHLSFTGAARELHVTHGAVSRHISQLEETLGKQLFVRRPRGLELTASARVYLVGIARAFEILRAATNDLTEQEHVESLRVRALPTFVSRWLVPRLQSLGGPPLEISLASIGTSVDFDRDDIDVLVQAGPSSLPRTVSYKLIDMDLIPVCSPHLVNGRPPPTELAELPEFTLLDPHGPRDSRHDLWAYWAQGAGVKSLHLSARSYFPSFDLVHGAAIEGLGIGIGARCFLEETLAAGTLIMPFDVAVRFPVPYFLIVPQDKLALPRVIRFLDWILNEAEKAADRARSPLQSHGISPCARTGEQMQQGIADDPSPPHRLFAEAITSQ